MSLPVRKCSYYTYERRHTGNTLLQLQNVIIEPENEIRPQIWL